MKVKVLAGLLAFSVILNVAGIIFFIGFLKAQGTIKHVKRERNQIAQNLSVLSGQSRVSEALASDDLVKCQFISHFDGQEDTFAFMPPRNPTAGHDGFDMVVYLHGMGSTFLEPFVCPDKESIAQAATSHNRRLVFLSLNYRRAWSWGNDAAISDISQNIREMMQRYPISRIILMGTSMGGCTALTYCALAPADIKAKICGAVSSEGAGDLALLYEKTGNNMIRPALVNAFGGTPEAVPDRYARQSFLPNLAQLPKTARIALISARRDSIVPPEFQIEIKERLLERDFETRLIEVDAQHGIPPVSCYLDGLEFVLAGKKS